MAKFYITLYYSGAYETEVEADGYDDALVKAREMVDEEWNNTYFANKIGLMEDGSPDVEQVTE